MTEHPTGHANALAYVQGNFVPGLPAEYADWLLDLVNMARANPGTGAQQLTVPPAVTATGRLPKAAVPQEDGSFIITLYSALASLHLEYELEPEQPTEDNDGDEDDLPGHVPDVEFSINRLMYLLRALATGQATDQENAEARTLHATFARLERASYPTAATTATPEPGEALEPHQEAAAHLAANLKALDVHARLELRQSGALLATMDHTAAAHLATWLDMCLSYGPLADILHSQPAQPGSGAAMAQTIVDCIRFGTDTPGEDLAAMLTQALPYERLDDVMNALHTLTGTVRPTGRGPAIND